jgi:hypothetical protein
MRIRECLHMLVMGYEPEEVARRMELTESEARDIAIKVGSWMDILQLKALEGNRIKHLLE